MKTIVSLFLGFFAIACLAEEPGAGYKLVQRIEPDNQFEFFGKPHKDIVQEVYKTTGEGSPAFKIILSSLADPSKKEFLFGFDRAARATLSPNGKWIVIDDRPSRGDCEPRLFKHQEGLKFSEVKEAQIRKRAIVFFVQHNKLSQAIRKSMIGEGDCFVESFQWAEDSDSLMLRISKERTGEPIWIWSWYCIYDLKKELITLDLDTLNRKAFDLNGKFLVPDDSKAHP